MGESERRNAYLCTERLYDSVRSVFCFKMKFLSEVGHAGRRGTTLRSCPLNFFIFFYCGLEADEGGVDLPHTGQRQHDLSPVLWVLLYRVSFEVDRLQRLGVLQLVEVGPVVYLIIVHLGRIPRTI